jgi:uncharacterized membrane protein
MRRIGAIGPGAANSQAEVKRLASAVQTAVSPLYRSPFRSLHGPMEMPPLTPNNLPALPSAGLKSLRPRLLTRLRNNLLAGILVTAPIGITIYLTWSLITWVDNRVLPLLPEQYNPENFLRFDLPGVGTVHLSFPGIGLIIAIAFFTAIGALTAGFVGRLFLEYSERLLNRMPVVRSIYGATKQIFETVLAQKSTAFREVVLVEFPRRGCWAIGFITGRTEGEIQELTEDDVLNVFVPTTPNPTSGYLFFVARKEVYPLSMSIEEGIKMVVSGGIVTPPDRRPLSARKTKIPAHSS